MRALCFFAYFVHLATASGIAKCQIAVHATNASNVDFTWNSTKWAFDERPCEMESVPKLTPLNDNGPIDWATPFMIVLNSKQMAMDAARDNVVTELVEDWWLPGDDLCVHEYGAIFECFGWYWQTANEYRLYV